MNSKNPDEFDDDMPSDNWEDFKVSKLTVEDIGRGNQIRDWVVIQSYARTPVSATFQAESKSLRNTKAIIKVVDRMSACKTETEILRKITNLPHFPTLFCAGSLDDSLWFLVVKQEGLDFFQLKELHTTITIKDCFVFIYQGVLALKHLHNLGILHGDIKLGNYVVGVSGDKNCLVLIDYGLATNFSQDKRDFSPPFEEMRTAHYTSPTVIRGGNLSDYTDTYGLGLCALQLAGYSGLHKMCDSIESLEKRADAIEKVWLNRKKYLDEVHHDNLNDLFDMLVVKNPENCVRGPDYDGILRAVERKNGFEPAREFSFSPDGRRKANSLEDKESEIDKIKNIVELKANCTYERPTKQSDDNGGKEKKNAKESGNVKNQKKEKEAKGKEKNEKKKEKPKGHEGVVSDIVQNKLAVLEGNMRRLEVECETKKTHGKVAKRNEKATKKHKKDKKDKKDEKSKEVKKSGDNKKK